MKQRAYPGAAWLVFKLMLNLHAGLTVDVSQIEPLYLDAVLDLTEAELANKYPGLLYVGWQNDFATIMKMVENAR